jgi:hypothetical protein
VVFSGQLTSAVYGQGALPPMLAVVDLPPWASLVSVLVVPLLGELAEPVATWAWSCPGWSGAWAGPGRPPPSWWPCGSASTPFPLPASGGGLDLGFAAYRVGSVLPFLAAWTAAYYAQERRLLPLMAARWVFNAGTAPAPTLGLVQ